MSVSVVYPFNNTADYNKTLTEVVGGAAKLALVANPGQVFAEDFADDTGFTYDNTKAEFVAGILRQKDQRPANAVLAATYTSFKNLNWSTSGSLVATDIGTPSILSGKLQCLGGGNNAVRYESADIGASGNVGALRLKYTPNYSGTPATNYTIFEFAPVSGNNDRMLLLHSASGGTLRLTAYTSVGTVKYSAVAFGAAWSPVAGTEYELELNWDTLAGIVRLFVNGVLQGSMTVSSYARGSDADRLYIGAGTVYTAADAEFNDVMLFSTAQHTANYTPGYTVPETIYFGSKVDGPNFSYSGVGTVLSVDDGSVVEVGLPRFIVGLQYWNGSAWVVSNGTYAQANDFATALANFPTFNTGGGGILPWSVVFTDSNALSSVDEFDVEVTGQKYPALGYLEPVAALNVKELVSYLQSQTTPANTSVKVILKIDGVLKYWNGTAWVTSDGTGAQANTAADVQTNLSSLVLGVNSTIYVRWVLESSVITSTPLLEEATVEYEFGAIEVDPLTCIVHGYYKDIANQAVAGATVLFALVKQETTEYSEAQNNIIEKSVSVLTDVNGYFATPLIRSSEYQNGGKYKVTITKAADSLSTAVDSGGSDLEFLVPDAETKDITDLLPTA